MAEGGLQNSPHVPTEVSLSSLRSSLSEFSDSHDCWLSKQDFEKKINDISDWVQGQKKAAEEKSTKESTTAKSVKESFEKVNKIATTTASAIQKFKSGNTYDIASGVTDIISSVSAFAAIGGPVGEAVGAIIGTICSIIGAIFTAMKPKQPSVVEQLAEVVHKELVGFNKKLQDEKYNGLKDRVSAQKVQLRIMNAGQDLVDPNLWNDYVQFMGELSYRFESPLPFKYDKNLTKDADVADFVTAVVTYCQAYNCLMALLIAVKGRFADLKEEKYLEMADLVILTQREAAKAKLAFLSDEKYLTFIGRLPYEGGKLTKILVLSRNSEGRGNVEMVLRGLGLPSLPDLKTVEYKANVVSAQSVKQPDAPTFSQFYRVFYNVQFINKTKFPMKIVCATVGKRHNNLKFTEVVQPGCSIMKYPNGSFSVGGYIVLYLDGRVRSDDDPHEPAVSHVIEFAMSWPHHGSRKINIQDKTASEFTKGQETYDKMDDRETKTIYWKTNDAHHMACGEIFSYSRPGGGLYGHRRSVEYAVLWRFIVRDFDPFLDVVPQDPMDPRNLPSFLTPYIKAVKIAADTIKHAQ